MKIRIRWEKGSLTATLNDSATAKAVYDALPVTSVANTWGKEVYFDLAVATRLANDARQVVDPGTVCYWVEGKSLALPFGPTPVSEGSECRLVTAVNVLGAVDGDPQALGTVRDGDMITVEALDE